MPPHPDPSFSPQHQSSNSSLVPQKTQDVKISMSAHLGRGLYAHLWESAISILGRVPANRLSARDAASRKVFESSFTSRRLSTPSRKITPLTRQFASGGFFVLGVSSGPTAAETSAACIVPSTKIVTQYIWKRALHTPNGSQREKGSSENPQPSRNDEASQSASDSDKPSQQNSQFPKPPQEPRQSAPPNRHLMDRLPHMPHLHRPTKEELLAAATGFWSRLKVRFKWFSIRSVRPFNLDEITALFSWVLLGHVVWVVVGTTTFFSLLILAINTVFAQGMYTSPPCDILC